MSDTVDGMSQRKTLFVSLNLTAAARDALRKATIELTGPAGRKVSMSDALIAALKTAESDRQTWVSHLLEESS